MATRDLDTALRAIPLTAWYGGFAGLIAVLVGVWTTAGVAYTMKATLDTMKSDLDDYKKNEIEARKDRESIHIELATIKAKCCFTPADVQAQKVQALTVPTMTSNGR